MGGCGETGWECVDKPASASCRNTSPPTPTPQPGMEEGSALTQVSEEVFRHLKKSSNGEQGDHRDSGCRGSPSSALCLASLRSSHSFPGAHRTGQRL